MKTVWVLLILVLLGLGVFFFGENVYVGLVEGGVYLRRQLIVEAHSQQARQEHLKQREHRDAEAAEERRQIAEAVAALRAATPAPDRVLPDRAKPAPAAWKTVTQDGLTFSLPPESDSLLVLPFAPETKKFFRGTETKIPFTAGKRTVDLRAYLRENRRITRNLVEWERWAVDAATPGWAGKDDSSISFDDATAVKDTFRVGEIRVLHLKGRMVNESGGSISYTAIESYAIKTPNDQIDEVFILTLRDGTQTLVRQMEQIVLSVRPAG